MLAEEYVVQVPWEKWCQEGCICRSRKCQHRGSDRYEEYEITWVESSWGQGMEGEGENTVTLERVAAPHPRKRVAHRDGTWDIFDVEWQEIAGVTRYGAAQLGMELVRREEGESSGSDTEQAYEAGEVRRAKRMARKNLELAWDAAKEEAAAAVASAGRTFLGPRR